MSPATPTWVALVHHPVLDRDGAVVTTSVTNLDVHDLARSARTYGAAGLVVVTPIEAQRRIVERIVSYWNEPDHVRRIPRRREALRLVHVAPDLDGAVGIAARAEGSAPVLVGTSARAGADRVGFAAMRARLGAPGAHPHLLVLGTGWGLADEALARMDAVLEPVEGAGGYNHMSVRSAAAVILDRLLGSGPVTGP